jgi:hypothetical protein
MSVKKETRFEDLKRVTKGVGGEGSWWRAGGRNDPSKVCTYE